MANPAPWATTAFGTTAFTLSLYQTGLLNSAGVLIVLPAAFFLGGLVLIISAVPQFARGDMFGGLGMGEQVRAIHVASFRSKWLADRLMDIDGKIGRLPLVIVRLDSR